MTTDSVKLSICNSMHTLNRSLGDSLKKTLQMCITITCDIQKVLDDNVIRDGEVLDLHKLNMGESPDPSID